MRFEGCVKPLCQTTAKFPGTLEITTVFLISDNLEDRVLKYRGTHPGMCGAEQQPSSAVLEMWGPRRVLGNGNGHCLVPSNTVVHSTFTASESYPLFEVPRIKP